MKITKDKLIQLYYQEEKTLQQIGNIYHLSKQRIRQKMIKFDLPRNPHRCGKTDYKFNKLQEYLEYLKETGRKERSKTLVRLVVSDHSLCQECGATNNLHIHHLHYPARLRGDLQILCASCHLTKHRKGNGVQIQLEICNKYLAGKNGTQLAKQYNVHSTRIYQILHKWNITKHYNKTRL